VIRIRIFELIVSHNSYMTESNVTCFTEQSPHRDVLALPVAIIPHACIPHHSETGWRAYRFIIMTNFEPVDFMFWVKVNIVRDYSFLLLPNEICCGSNLLILILAKEVSNHEQGNTVWNNFLVFLSSVLFR